MSRYPSLTFFFTLFPYLVESMEGLTSSNPWKALDLANSGSGSGQSIIDRAVLQRNYIFGQVVHWLSGIWNRWAVAAMAGIHQRIFMCFLKYHIRKDDDNSNIS